MLTQEQSRSIRAELGLSQRRVAAEADVPRSYLNQFERGRWIPTDAFLSKLTDFYEQFDGITVDDPAWESADQASATDVSGTTNDPPIDIPALPTNSSCSEDTDNSKTDWQNIGKAVLAIGLIGGILAVSGNLPAALIVLRRVANGLQARSPLGP